ncbi:DUF1853 family protein [Psychrobacter sp. 16-MNA-CIBAN-0192]|uniref:DUF1853 family protein n=1 Tax=Psychrobacter sp. 16-MNA-CIBAN-0192 TaxID=3140448 RepID=UPI00332581F9
MSEPTALPLPTLSNHSNISDDAPWEQYQRPYVRDLAFALACPNVLTHWIDFTDNENDDGSHNKSSVNSTDKSTAEISVHSADFWNAQYKAYQERLEILDSTNAYQVLTRYLLARPSPSRLGFHFEGLLSFWLTDGFTYGYHPYEILASNVQLYCGKQTSGELDIVLYNHQEKLTEHWELAIKFFMGSAPFAPVNWVGINSNDNLQRKMTHMQTKQFRTLAVDTKNHGNVIIDKRYAVIKGRFFSPITLTEFHRPDWLSPTFPQHRWYDSRDSAHLAHINMSRLRRARYIEWFTQRACYDDAILTPPLWQPHSLPQTGQYFDGSTPLVIYPRYQNSDLAQD